MRLWRCLLLSLVIMLMLAACKPPASEVLLPAGLDSEPASPAECWPTGLFNAYDLVMPPGEGDWRSGAPDAVVTIITYSDLQCADCAQLDSDLQTLQAAYPGDVQVVYRHFLQDGGDKSMLAAQAVEAAGRQSAEYFFALKTVLFDHLQEWQSLPPAQFSDWVVTQAAALGLDSASFQRDFNDPQLAASLQAISQQDASGAVLLPVVFINGGDYRGALDLATLKAVVEVYRQTAQAVGAERLAAYPPTPFSEPLELQRALAFYQEIESNMAGRIYDACPPQVIKPEKQYTATIVTAKGNIVIRLNPEQAPFTVNNFVFLAQQGWYDGLTFHRVLPGFIAQTGDPSGYGMGGPGYVFSDEISLLRFDQPGMVAMANSGLNTNGSQFFITDKALPQLDGLYAIFGQVVDGMDVVRKLTERDPGLGGELPAGDRIDTIIIEEIP